MGLIKTAGIVTKEIKYGETGKIVTLITRDLGKISAIASNVRTSKSRMLAGLQLFAYSEFVLFKGKGKKGLYHLNEVTMTESFQNIRTSLEDLAYASYFAEIANHVSQEENPDEELLRLLLNTLFALDRRLSLPEKIKTVFEWRVSAVAGYAPLLDSCSNCGAKDMLSHLNPSDGRIMCSKCGALHPSAIPLSTGMVNVISYISGADSRQIFSFDSNDDTIAYLSRVSEIYISTQLEQEFQTLDYLKKVVSL